MKAAMASTNIGLGDVQAAAQRIAPYITRTPIVTSNYFNNKSGKRVFFKCENFQKIGAFKYRGATNAVLRLKEEAVVGHIKFVTHSSGNHAQALALAAQVQGMEAHIVMPSNAPLIKKNAVRGYGATIYECFPTQEAREQKATELLNNFGAQGVYVPPYDHPYIIAGAGTMVLEILHDYPHIDTFIVPVGGGGMLSGICIAAKGINSKVKIYAAEPIKANDCAMSFAAKERRLNPKYPDTIADGLRVNVGKITWPIIRDNISGVITVSEEEIIEATRLVFERMKLVIEPSAGVGVAALLSEQFREINDVENVAIILCGGNIDLYKIPWV